MSRSSSLASALRGRNLSSLALAALGCLLGAPALICIGLLLYVATMAAERRHVLAARLPAPQTLSDFEVRLAVGALAEARAAARRALALLPPSLAPEVKRVPAVLDELEQQARPLVEQAEVLGCFLLYRARRPELERESLQLAAEITRAPAARREYQAAREVVLRQLRICDELSAERERLLAVLTHIATLVRGLPLELARLSLEEARLRGSCDERPACAPLQSLLAELGEAATLRVQLRQHLLAT